jgi:hypothetical protein
MLNAKSFFVYDYVLWNTTKTDSYLNLASCDRYLPTYKKFEYSMWGPFNANCCNTNGRAQQNFDRFVCYKVMSPLTAFILMSATYTSYFSSSFHFSEYHQQNISKVPFPLVFIQYKYDCSLEPDVPYNMCNINYEDFCYYERRIFLASNFAPGKKIHFCLRTFRGRIWPSYRHWNMYSLQSVLHKYGTRL